MKFRRTIAGIAAFTLIFTGMPSFAAAAQSTVQEYSAADAAESEEILEFFELDDHAILKNCAASAKGTIVIPSSYNGLPVTAVGPSAFRNCEGIETAIIPSSVESIEEQAFMNCKSLTYISVPESVKNIADHAFCGCSSLETIEILNPECSIAPEKSTICKFGYEPVGFGGTIVGAEGSAAEAYAKKNGYRFRDTALSDSLEIKAMGDHAVVEKCAKGTSGTVMIPLYSEGLPVTEISIAAFDGLSEITEIIIPPTVKRIGPMAFNGCSGLTSVSFSDSLEEISTEAFRNCSSLETIGLGMGIKNIGKGAFSGTAWYENAGNGIVYLADWVCGYKGTLPSYGLEIKEGTTGIAAGAFSGCNEIEELKLPEGLKYICGSAFMDCVSLYYFELPESLEYIGEYAFFNTYAIDVYLSRNVKATPHSCQKQENVV